MIGYCCICLGINEGRKKKDYISVNRGMVKRTFETKGLSYVSELVILNLKDTLEILKWNIKNNIYVYRMSSDSFPWMSEYEFTDLPNWNNIHSLLIQIGYFIKENNIRVGFHPGPYTVISSENPNVVLNSINDLNKHAQILDYMCLPQNTYYGINIHINSTKPTREISAQRFCVNFKLLSESAQKRLTIENDDKLSQYSVKMLYDMIYKEIGIPIVFDQHHYNYGPQDLSMEESIKLASTTWKEKQLTHISSSRKIEDKSSVSTAHSDYIYEKIESFGLDFDTEIEAKSKDLAVFKYINNFN